MTYYNKYIDIYCLKSILLQSSQKDLMRWRLVSKNFKQIIESLYPDVDFYTACKKGLYVVINNKLKNNFYNWNKALKKSTDINVVKLLISKGADSKNSFNKVFINACKIGNIDLIKLLIDHNVTNFKKC